MRVLLDTSIIIEFWKKRPDVVEELAGLVASGLFISEVTAAELVRGALHKADLRVIQNALRYLEILPLEAAIGQGMLELLNQYGLSHGLQIPDALIAATTLRHGIPLYTLNRKDFRYIAGLQLYEPA